MKKITLLGSTGSVGRNTLKIVYDNFDKYKIVALIAGKNVQLMLKQCLIFNPLYAAMEDEKSARKLSKYLKLKKSKTKVFFGIQSACDLAKLTEVDQVVSAIVGIAGLLPTMAAINAGKHVLLANKESLVTCGKLLTESAKKNHAKLHPIDSEHNAIFQILPFKMQKQLGFIDLHKNGIQSIILTGSGGPFLHTPINDLVNVTPDQACLHPNWIMGNKIAVDSATMMNKGLEYIEAKWLFNANNEQIEVILHPESIIHSMVRYVDGSVIAQLASPDMRLPISYCMFWPNRFKNKSVPLLDFIKIKSLTFNEIDLNRFPCFKLAVDACAYGQASTIILNAVNEIAVQAFLRNQINFIDIVSLNSEVLSSLTLNEPDNVEMVIEIDKITRELSYKLLPRFMKYK